MQSPALPQRRPTLAATPPDDPADDADDGDGVVAPPDRTVVGRVRSGDAAAFHAMVETHREPLCLYVLGFVRHLALAEELVQDVFLGVWSRRERWTAPGGVRAYLYAAARNRALNHLRHERTARRAAESGELVPDEGPPHADAATHERELATAVSTAVAALPGRCRDVFLLQRRRGLTYAQIARELGVSVKTVETQMSRALRSLRRALAPYR